MNLHTEICTSGIRTSGDRSNGKPPVAQNIKSVVLAIRMLLHKRFHPNMPPMFGLGDAGQLSCFLMQCHASHFLVVHY